MPAALRAPTKQRLPRGRLGSRLLRPGPTPELPQQVAGLKLWLDATKITGLSDGQGIATWNDASGNSNHVVQGTGTKQPVYKTAIRNGLPVARFTAANSQVVARSGGPLGLAVQTLSVFVVRSAATSGDRAFIHWGDESGGVEFRQMSAGKHELLRANQASLASSTATYTAGTWDVAAVTHASGSQAFYKTTNAADGTGTTANTFTYAGTQYLMVGAQATVGGAGSEFYDGDIAELIVYDNVVSSGDRAALFAYLEAKWGFAGTNAPADVAAGTGLALDALASLGATADQATGTGAALDATASLGAQADHASGTGTAPDASVALQANADAATATGTAPDATASLGANAEAASGTGTAYDATVQTSAGTNAPADVAAATGTAYDAGAALAVNADIASGTGTALDASGGIGAQADIASGVGAALDASVAIAVTAGVAAGIGTAYDAVALTDIQATADIASGTGSALDAGVAIAVTAGVATATGTALDAVGQPAREAPAGVAAATGSALDAAVGIGVAAEVATATGLALDATVYIPPPVPPPRWVEGAATANGLIEGDGSGSGQIEGVLVGAGIVEGGSSL